MEINIKDILTLSDNNRYGVVSKTNYQGKIYYYLVDVVNVENMKFWVEGDNKLTEIEDKNLIKTLIPLLADEIKDEMDEMLS